jgi:hypothetical protein
MTHLAIGLGLIAIVLLWHKMGHKFNGFLLVLIGAGSAVLISSLVGTLIPSWVVPFALVAAAIAWHQQTHKGNKRHKIGTPVIALLLGFLLVQVGGPIGGAFDHIQGTVEQTVSKVTSGGSGGAGVQVTSNGG